MSSVSIFKETPKSHLIKAYRKYLLEEKRWRKKNDGFGKKKPCNLERPTINGQVYSWRQFSRLPKESVIVHVFTEGCDAEFISKLKKDGFFEPRDLTDFVFMQGQFKPRPKKVPVNMKKWRN